MHVSYVDHVQPFACNPADYRAPLYAVDALDPREGRVPLSVVCIPILESFHDVAGAWHVPAPIVVAACSVPI